MNPFAEPGGARRASVAALLGLILVAVLYHGPALWGGRTYAFVDASRFFYPLFKWGSAVWGSGRLPLWNSDMDCGAPYWADPQMACAYWPSWILYAILGPVTAFNLSIFLHQAWALAGFWYFARRRGLSIPASFAGALAFGFSLHVTCSSWTPVALYALAWIPWIFAAGEGLREGRRWAFSLLAAALALQMAAGYPVVAYLTALGLWAHLALRPGAFFGRLPRWFWMLAGAYGLAALINLAWGLPFAEYFSLTNHGSGASGYYQALQWNDLWTFLMPFPNGNPLSGSYSGFHYWVVTYYMGWAVPAFLLFRVVRGKREWGTAALWGLALWLSLGETAYLGGWLKHFLPGYALVIRSGFWLGPVVFFGAWLAAEGVEDLDGLLGKGSGKIGWACAALVAATILPTAWSVRFTLPHSYYEAPPKALALMDRPGRIMHAPQVLVAAKRLEAVDIETAYDESKERMLPDWPFAWGKACAVAYNTLGLERFRSWREGVLLVSPFLSRSALDYLGVRYLLGGHHFSDLVPAGDAGGIPLSLNPRCAGEWFCPPEARPAEAMEADWKTMDDLHEGFDRLAFAEPLGWNGPAAERTVTEAEAPHGVTRLDIGPGGRALLVSSDAAAPGWKVWVDGARHEPLIVNHAFRGLELRPEDHVVEWRYDPDSFRLGLFLSLAALGLWVAMVLKVHFGKRIEIKR